MAKKSKEHAELMKARVHETILEMVLEGGPSDLSYTTLAEQRVGMFTNGREALRENPKCNT
ncbi:hypothetical protein C9J01_10285 [Photobacterium rosenbergii]|uniref:Uncharacterized protein n=1 Tax=Photobacterium rosenbergii TaxID=294936 RepID=A0A2T3NFB7_9GAMM|nr:hypothetical protein [Photobacterium rosenbergii]PSW13234.1 hypothetical protein C9J01_10285 [Photobacterium rosenbergii]